MPLDPQVAAILQMFAALPEPDYATLDARSYHAVVAQQGVPQSNLKAQA